MPTSPFISCYIDANGFGIITGLKEYFKNEVEIVFLEDAFISKISSKEILDKIVEFKDKYKVTTAYANHNMTDIINNMDSLYLDWKCPEIDLEKMVVIVTCAMNDGKIKANSEYQERLLEIINQFDKDEVNHISYALMYGINFEEHSTYWLSII